MEKQSANTAKKGFSLTNINIDKNLFLILLAFYTAYELISIFKTLLVNEINFQRNPAVGKPNFFIEIYIIDWLVVLLFMFLAVKFIKRTRLSKMKLVPLILVHLIMSFLMGLAIFVVTYWVFKLLGKLPNTGENPVSGIFFRVLQVSDDNFLVYFAMLAVIYSYSYFKNLSAYKSLQSNLQSQLVETKMSLLKSQLDPHFIFNTLNNISSLIDINADEAQKNIADLSDLLREIIDSKRENVITLEKELYILDKYISLVLTRFSEDVVITKKINAKLNHVFVPNLIIQSIIENSIKHGFSYKIKALKIDLEIAKKGAHVWICVKNNGKYLEKDFSELLKKGSGLKNISDRLATIYGEGRYDFVVKNREDGQGVITEISIPVAYDAKA